MNAIDFKDLIFQMCGSEYHRVEVSDDVWDNFIVPKVTNKFVEFHFDGSTKKIVPLQIINNQTDYLLDSEIESVTSIISPDTIPGTISPIHLYKEKMFREGSVMNLSDFTLFQGWISQMRITTGNYYHYGFNKITKTLRLYNPSQLPSEVFLEVYIDSSVDSIDLMRENTLYQEMSMALTNIMWAKNLKKYDRALIGGSTINWKDIEDDGKEMWEKCIEELKNEQSESPEIEFG